MNVRLTLAAAPSLAFVEQVGGNHYNSGYEHWDFVLRCGLGYLEGNATKYLTRWRRKNGLQDLHKARSYVEKLLGNPAWGRPLARQPLNWVRQELTRFFEANKLLPGEAAAISLIALWETEQDLREALDYINGLIDAARPGPVPLTEENHHAERTR